MREDDEKEDSELNEFSEGIFEEIADNQKTEKKRFSSYGWRENAPKKKNFLRKKLHRKGLTNSNDLI